MSDHELQAQLLTIERNDVLRILVDLKVTKRALGKGAEPLLNLAEAALICGHTTFLADCELGKSAGQICTDVRRELNKLGENMPDEIDRVWNAGGIVCDKDKRTALQLGKCKFGVEMYKRCKARVHAAGFLGPRSDRMNLSKIKAVDCVKMNKSWNPCTRGGLFACNE